MHTYTYIHACMYVCARFLNLFKLSVVNSNIGLSACVQRCLNWIFFLLSSLISSAFFPVLSLIFWLLSPWWQFTQTWGGQDLKLILASFYTWGILFSLPQSLSQVTSVGRGLSWRPLPFPTVLIQPHAHALPQFFQFLSFVVEHCYTASRMPLSQNRSCFPVPLPPQHRLGVWVESRPKLYYLMP